MNLWRFLLCLLPVVGVAKASPIGDFDTYVYKLELNANNKLCRHMERVYNTEFRRPWDYRDRSMRDAFPRLEGVETDELARSDLRYSAYPTTPEFEAIEWREGRKEWPNASSGRIRPILVAEFDIDNDGRTDLVVKGGFMLSIRPADSGRSAGGEDRIHILAPDSIERGKTLNAEVPFEYTGQKYPSQISGTTLRYTDRDRPYPLTAQNQRMEARSIRPFLFDGKTYLSVYVPWAVTSGKHGREWMWVLQYHGGGRNLGKGKWEPANVESLCRFRMVATKTKMEAVKSLQMEPRLDAKLARAHPLLDDVDRA